MGDSNDSCKREVCSDTGLPQDIRKISNILTYHVKELEQKEQKKA